MIVSNVHPKNYQPAKNVLVLPGSRIASIQIEHNAPLSERVKVQKSFPYAQPYALNATEAQPIPNAIVI
jgi:hypothetical protein